MPKRVLAPGCALQLYKPHLVEKLHGFLSATYGAMDLLLTCCRHTPQVAPGTQVVNICPGCDRRYRENYADPSTVSLWELLLEGDAFAFPDYKSQRMTIIDACPTRDQDRIHRSVRALAERMNISIVEPARTKTKSTCCGDIFYGTLPTGQVVDQMKAKAGEMPVDDVLVYCVSCSKAMFVGGRRPRYLVDLLFGEDTVPGTCDPEEWHGELDEFIENHRDLDIRSG
jgi:hypothetical protein